MTPHQLHTLIAHELAHIRRYDVLVNLVQTAVETLLFFHPAVWWMSSQVREEREKCCDDMAVRISGCDAGAYATALLSLAEWRGQHPLLVAQASGAGESLLRRVMRLMAAEPERVRLGPRWMGGVVVAACAALFLGDAPAERDLFVGETRLPAVATHPVVAASTIAERAPPVARFADTAAIVRLVAKRLADSTRSDAARERAARELAGYVTPAALAALARAARSDGDRDVRRDALRAIGAMRLAAAADTLMSMYESAGRRSTSIAVIEAFGARSEPRVLEVLRAIVRSADDDDLRSEAIESLASLPGGRGAPAILEIALRDPRAESRREAISEIPEVMPAAVAIDVLAGIMHRERGSDVALAAAEAMAEVRDPGAVRFLAGLAMTDSGSRIRRRAIRSLADAALRDEAGRALLAIARSHPEPVLRREAIDALVELDERGTVGDLMQLAVTDPDSLVQGAAVVALGDVRPRATAIDSLAHVVRTHERSAVRYAALRQLGDFDRERKAGVVIAELARTSDDPAVRARAEMMLRKE
jgi:HEAT repeat protein